MMISKIRTEAQYNQVMALIETFITQATAGGGFNSLSDADAEELAALSLLAEQYEDDVLKIMPL
ncbi:MAG: hypothetical protein ACYCZO_11930, partial [Daejeonella sp.]